MPTDVADGPSRNLPPCSRCLRLHGPSLEAFEIGAPDTHAELIRPGPGSGVIRELVSYERRRVTYAESVSSRLLRIYTAIRFEASRSGREVERALHGGSPLDASLKRARVDYENIAEGPAVGGIRQWMVIGITSRGMEPACRQRYKSYRLWRKSSARSPCSRQWGMSGWRWSRAR